MTVLEARRDARLRRYDLRRHRLAVAGGVLSIVAPAAASAPVQRAAAASASSGREPPYWAQIWPASVGLARWLCRRKDLGGMAVTDLGCGIGVAAAAAARAGAAVLACDVADEALPFAAFNLQRNAAAGAPPPAVQRFDWQRQDLQPGARLLLLADVSYRSAHHLPLLRQLRGCLPGGAVALHCDPFRPQSDGFLALASREFVAARQELSAHFDGQTVPLRLCLLAADAAALRRWSGSGGAAA